MPAIRSAFFVALLLGIAHAAFGRGDVGPIAVAARNLLWWQALSALAGGLVAAIAFPLLRRSAAGLAVAPTLLVGLELSAWLVGRNAHHTLAPVPRLLAFVAAWILPAVAAWLWARRRPRLRWMTPVQALIVVAALALSAGTRPPAIDPGARPDLALIVLDAVQVRALGHRGAPLDPSPRIDELAARGFSSNAAFSAAATSVPGHAAILFGLDVAEHGAPTNDFDLPGGLPAPLADRLRERGYTTAGFCHNPLVSRRAGFARGFDVWWNWGEPGWMQSPLEVALLRWPAIYLWARASDRDLVTLTQRVALPAARGPLFTFVQLLYTHNSYVDGDGWATPARVDSLHALIRRGELSNRTGHDDREIAGLHASYLGAVAYSDRLVGETIDRLSARAGARGLVVVLTADHGENLAEHGDEAVSRHFGPWSTTLRIPLVVADTRLRTGGVDGEGLASNQRVQRLLLDAADERLPAEPDAWTHHVEESLGLDPAFVYSAPWLVLVDDSLKVALNHEDLTRPPLVHRWREDFEDQDPVTAATPAVQRRWDDLLARYERMRAAGLFQAPADIDPEKLEHLRALGYIE